MKDIDQYQLEAAAHAIYPGRGSFLGAVYCSLKMAGEAGEIADKVGKAWRDDDGAISDERAQALLKEMGDVLWYVANLAAELDYLMSEVTAGNIEKISDRRERGVQHGEGDDR